MMDKLISQQAAIDVLKELTANGTNKGMVFGEDAVHRIEMLPSAQPETPMQIGWICPVCGRGLSPLTSVCPCNNGKGWKITC